MPPIAFHDIDGTGTLIVTPAIVFSVSPHDTDNFGIWIDFIAFTNEFIIRDPADARLNLSKTPLILSITFVWNHEPIFLNIPVTLSYAA